MVEFTNFVVGGTWENRKAKWLVLMSVPGRAGKTPMGIIKWDKDSEDYAYFLQGNSGRGLCPAALNSAQVTEIQRKLYELEVKNYVVC